MNYRFFCGFKVKGVQKKWGQKYVKNFAIRDVFSLLPESVCFSFRSPFRMLQDYKAGFTIWVVVSAIFIDIFRNKHFTYKEMYNVISIEL